MKKALALFLALVLTVSLSGCGAAGSVSCYAEGSINGSDDGDGNGLAAVADETQGKEGTPERTSAVFAENYLQVYEKLMEISQITDGGALSFQASDNTAVDADMAYVTSEAAEDNGDSGAGAGYSTTNTQVEGIDEGDIVKTDGEYIYALQGNDLVIFRAAGADTAELSRIAVGYGEHEDGESGWYSKWKNPSELYVFEGGVAVVSDYGSYRDYQDESGSWQYESEDCTVIDLYDVSDPKQPEKQSELGQDGGRIASRFADGVLYMITSYGTWDWDENRPETYIPRLYLDGETMLVNALDICIVGSPVGTAYTVITAYDVSGGAVADAKTVLGGGDTVYMNGDNLFIAGSRQEIEESEPRTESVYTVVDYTESWSTEITRFSLTDGSLFPAANGRVPGVLESQFSMDEYDGHLRMVTTLDTYSYTVYTDEERGFVNYEWNDDAASLNNLYILDADISVVGSIENLAENERIYSARFDGEIGYFCTFETVDPLFSVDLSDPENPKILSALKIPGFSEYLHVWSDGLLMGLGYDTSVYGENGDEWVTTDGVKLSMFDVSDPANVTEAYKLSLDSSYSEALYNHKAILVSADKNLIAFPVEDGYAVYGFSEDGGFYEKAVIECQWAWNARGLYIDDCFYVVSQGAIAVLNLDTLALICEINTAVG
jgi:inhibitor of cysteine peptidase